MCFELLVSVNDVGFGRRWFVSQMITGSLLWWCFCCLPVNDRFVELRCVYVLVLCISKSLMRRLTQNVVYLNCCLFKLKCKSVQAFAFLCKTNLFNSVRGWVRLTLSVCNGDRICDSLSVCGCTDEKALYYLSQNFSCADQFDRNKWPHRRSAPAISPLQQVLPDVVETEFAHGILYNY